MSLTAYPRPGRKLNLKICTDFANSAHGKVAENERYLKPGPAFFHGWDHHCAPLLQQAWARPGIDWYYSDNAYYFGRGEYFRITKNALMHDGMGKAPGDRFDHFGLRQSRWQKKGGHIVVTTQSSLFYEVRMNMTRDQWVAHIRDTLSQHTDREIRIYEKPLPGESGNAPAHAGFETGLDGAHAMVTHSSSTAVKALLEGIPVFCEPICMAACMGQTDLALIETPAYPDHRRQFFNNLAANQWTLGEINQGMAWEHLNNG